MQEQLYPTVRRKPNGNGKCCGLEVKHYIDISGLDTATISFIWNTPDKVAVGNAEKKICFPICPNHGGTDAARHFQ